MHNAILSKFSDVTVAVFGDVMLDRYLIGDVARISPEAPVPVVDLKEERIVAGGAANVAANIAGLGAKVSLLSVTGADDESRLLGGLCESMGIAFDGVRQSSKRHTSVKTRILAESHQIARVDRETVLELDTEDSEMLLASFDEIAGRVDVLVISDYGKGVADGRTLSRLIAAATSAGIPVLADPKGLDYTKYDGVTILTPNRKEAQEVYLADHRAAGTVEDAGFHILANTDIDNLVITLGADGMALFRNGKETIILPASARNVFDVTGAGDTVIGTLAVATGAGADLEMAAGLANLAAGIVVERVGTTAVTYNELAEALEDAAEGESSYE